MKKNNSRFKDDELQSKFVDEVYESGAMANYVDFTSSKPAKKYTINYARGGRYALIGLRLDKEIIDFTKKYSKLRGLQYQAVLKDWIANGYLASLKTLEHRQSKK